MRVILPVYIPLYWMDMLHMRVILQCIHDPVEDGHVAHEGDITCVYDYVEDPTCCI